ADLELREAVLLEPHEALRAEGRAAVAVRRLHEEAGVVEAERVGLRELEGAPRRAEVVQRHGAFRVDLAARVEELEADRAPRGRRVHTVLPLARDELPLRRLPGAVRAAVGVR